MAAASEEKVWTVILAAGRGQRFGGPKQFERLGNERVIDRVVRIAGATADGTTLVLPHGTIWDGQEVDHVLPGGATHMASARAGLGAVPSDVATVLVALPSHPLATEALYRRLLRGVADSAVAACAPSSSLPDALKEVVDGEIVRTHPRDALMAVPFPAAFDAETLRSALNMEVNGLEVDYAEELEAVERIGGKIAVIANEPTNLHITSPEELAMACLLLPLVD